LANLNDVITLTVSIQEPNHAVLALLPISTGEIHAHTFLVLDSAWVGASRSCHFPFVSRTLACLAMCHSRDYRVEILNYAELVFERNKFWPSVKSQHVFFTEEILPYWTVRWIKILANVIFLSSQESSRVFGVGILNNAKWPFF